MDMLCCDGWVYIVFYVMNYGYECDIYCLPCDGSWICDIYIVLCYENGKNKKRKIFPPLPSATLGKFAMALGKAGQK